MCPAQLWTIGPSSCCVVWRKSRLQCIESYKQCLGKVWYVSFGMDFWNIEDKFPISRLLSVAVIILSFPFPSPPKVPFPSLPYFQSTSPLLPPPKWNNNNKANFQVDPKFPDDQRDPKLYICTFNSAFPPPPFPWPILTSIKILFYQKVICSHVDSIILFSGWYIICGVPSCRICANVGRQRSPSCRIQHGRDNMHWRIQVHKFVHISYVTMPFQVRHKKNLTKLQWMEKNSFHTNS